MTPSGVAADAAPGPATASLPKFAIFALSAAAFASGLSLRLTDPLLLLICGEFHVSAGRAAFVITAFSIAYGASQLFFGPVGDRFGKYRVVAWACGACAVTAAMCGFATSFEQLVAARFLAGATAAAIIPLSMAWIGDVVDYEHRQPVLARFLVGQILGLSAGVLIGGFAAEHLSRHLPFFGVSAIFAAITCMLFAVYRRLPRHAKPASSTSRHGLTPMVDAFRDVFDVPWARTVLICVLFEGAAVFGAFAFIATHLHRNFGLTLSLSGAVVMLFGLGGMVFALASSWFVHRLGEVGLAVVGGVLLSGALLVTASAAAWWWAMPAGFTAGLGFYMLHNTLQTNATQMVPERRGAAVSASSCCFYLGQTTGVALAGAAVGHWGTARVIGASALVSLIVAMGFARARSRHRSPSATPATR